MVSVYHTTQRHTPEDRNLDIYRIQKIKCHLGMIWFSSGRAKHRWRPAEVMVKAVSRSARKTIRSAIKATWGRDEQARQECGVALGWSSTRSPNIFRHIMSVTRLQVYWWVDALSSGHTFPESERLGCTYWHLMTHFIKTAEILAIRHNDTLPHTSSSWNIAVERPIGKLKMHLQKLQIPLSVDLLTFRHAFLITSPFLWLDLLTSKCTFPRTNNIYLLHLGCYPVAVPLWVE